MNNRVITAVRKSPWYKGFFLLLPFVFAVCAIGCAVVLLFESVIAPSEYYRVLTGGSAVAGTVSGQVEQEEGHIPTIAYESQWATLCVDGWNRQDIPVYFGDSNAILRRGAGMLFNSRFCGQGGKTVLSAHVTTHFKEIEDTAIGTQVTMNTVYGEYVYVVTDIQIFHYQDNSLILPDDGENTLLMYTCYPRENGYKRRVQRIALICKMVSGKEWSTYG